MLRLRRKVKTMEREYYKYFDKNGEQIAVGDTLVDDEGRAEKVYACQAEDDDMIDLGFDANNPNFSLGYNPQKYYPLSQFDLSEYAIVK